MILYKLPGFVSALFIWSLSILAYAVSVPLLNT